MRKILCFFLALTMLIPLTACRKNTAADENILQNLYTQVTDEPLVKSMDAIPSNVVFADGKYYVFSREDNREAYLYDKTADAYEEKSYFIVMDENGAVSETIPLALQSVNGQTLTERGLFAIPFENGENHFRWFDLTGAVLAEFSLDGIRPDGGADKPSLSTNSPFAIGTLPIVAAEDEIAMLWGKKLAFYDDTLTMTATLELPGNSVGITSAHEGYYVTYSTGAGLTITEIRDHAIVREYATPAYMNGANAWYEGTPIDCYGGYFYFYKDDMVYRYRLAEDADPEKLICEPVADLLQSGITGSVRGVDLFFRGKNDRPHMAILTMDGSASTLRLYRPSEDIALTQATVLHLIGMDIPEDIKAEVARFHGTHENARILVTDYSKYRTKENFLAGYDRFKTDLTSRVVKADILVLSGNDLKTLTKRLPGYLVDLYPLMTGEVQRDSIYQSVRDYMETDDGKLYGIFRSFQLEGLVGRTDVLEGRTGWNLAEFLDFCDGLTDGEHLMEELSRKNYTSMLFGQKQYRSFIRNGKAAFNDPLFLRYLTFLQTLPETGQTYMTHATNNYDALFAGELSSEDQLEVTEGGENLYWNGKIKLEELIGTMYGYYRLAHVFGTRDITCIGYPAEDKHGVNLRPDSQLAITSDCAEPSLAWEFIESYLTRSSPVQERYVFDALRSGFYSVRALQETRFARYSGYELFFYHDGDTKTFDKTIALDENGTLNGRAGDHYVITADDIARVTAILEGEVVSFWDFDGMVASIAEEEESRYLGGAIPAEECAKNIDSRVGIYLSENE